MGNPCPAGDSHLGSAVAGDSLVAVAHRTCHTCLGVSSRGVLGAGNDAAVVLAAVVVDAAVAVDHAAVVVAPLMSAFSPRLAVAIVAVVVDEHSSLAAADVAVALVSAF